MKGRFFPKNIFHQNDEEDDQKHRLYGGQLITMHEKPIYNLDSSDVTIYRLVVVRSFRIPILIKITIEKNENHLKAIVPGEVYRTREKEIHKTLTEQEIQGIERYLEQMDFWNIKPGDVSGGIILDGGYYLFEVYDKIKKYYVIERVSAKYNFALLVKYLLDLAGTK